MPKTTNPNLFKSWHYFEEQGLWTEPVARSLWLLHHTGAVCGLELTEGALRFKSINPGSVVFECIVSNTRLNVLLGQYDKIDIHSEKNRRKFPGQTRPSSFYKENGKAIYRLGNKVSLEAINHVEANFQGLTMVEGSSLVFKWQPEQLDKVLKSKNNTNKNTASMAWQLQRELSSDKPSPAKLLTTIGVYGEQLSLGVKKEIYIAITDSFNKAYISASKYDLNLSASLLSKKAGTWADLIWWQANHAAIFLALQGLQLAEKEGYLRQFRGLSEFLANHRAGDSWLYSKQWYGLPENIEFSKYVTSLDRKKLETETYQLLAKYERSLRLSQKELKNLVNQV
ncbi:MAG: hypothetical protein WDZ81_00905 [Candidatus Saccharimonadales bacterium]